MVIKKIFLGLLLMLACCAGKSINALTVHNESGTRVNVLVYYEGAAKPVAYELSGDKKLSSFTGKLYCPFIYVADTGSIINTLTIAASPNAEEKRVDLSAREVRIKKIAIQVPGGSGQIVATREMSKLDYEKDFFIDVKYHINVKSEK